MTFNEGAFWVDLMDDLADPEFREAFIDAVIMFQGDWHEDRLEEEILNEEMSSLHDVWTDGNGAKWYVHKRNIDCDIDGCVIHNPSYHPLSDSKQIIRTDKYMLVEDICSHGVGHPNPDSASFISKKITGDNAIWVHGCDGCCRTDTPKPRQERGFGMSERKCRGLYEGMTPDMFGYEGDY